MASTVLGLTFDAQDAEVAARFWAQALNRTLADGATSEHATVEGDPGIPGSRIGFHRVPEGKSVKNRLHLDLLSADFTAEVERLRSLGATVLNEFTGSAHWVTLADPEGNEFDVIAG